MPLYIKIIIGLATVVVLLVIVITLQPSSFRIARSATMLAPRPRVFAEVNDLHKWEAWSPWVKMDPNCKMTYEGSPPGTGASVFWSGNKKVGEGRMTITDSRPGEMVRIKLEFLRPFKATNTTEFTFAPVTDDATTVTWSMTGERNFFFKAFGLFMNMDKLIGGDFERGLASMKSKVEANVEARQ